MSAGCALPAAGAAQAFTGNVCSLLKSPQLQAVEVQPVCKARPPVNVKGRATIYGAFWGGAGNIADPSYHRLTVQVWQARSSSFAAIFMKRAVRRR